MQDNPKKKYGYKLENLFDVLKHQHKWGPISAMPDLMLNSFPAKHLLLLYILLDVLP